MYAITPAEFLGTPVSIIDHAGRRWLTAEHIGFCLGYAEDKARIAISNLYNRHTDEFTAEDTCVIKLMTGSRGEQTTRIFSHTGCIKLGFFAATPKARDFRAWAAKVLAGEAAPPAPVKSASGASIRITRAVERQALELFAAGQSYRQIAYALGISVPAVSLIVNGKYRFHPAAGPSEVTPALIEAVVARHAEREQARIAEQYCASLANQDLVAALDGLGRRMLAQLGAEV